MGGEGSQRFIQHDGRGGGGALEQIKKFTITVETSHSTF